MMLHDLRTAREMTQDEVAAAAGITRQTLSRIEAGRGVPHALTIAALARVYGVTVDEIRTAFESSAAVG